MNKRWMSGVVVAVCLMLLTSATWADKAEVEKKAKETKVTLSLKEMAPAAALDIIALMGGITIKKTDIPKDAPKVTAELKEVSVLDCVKLVTELAGLTCAIVDDGIEVSGKKKD